MSRSWAWVIVAAIAIGLWPGLTASSLAGYSSGKSSMSRSSSSSSRSHSSSGSHSSSSSFSHSSSSYHSGKGSSYSSGKGSSFSSGKSWSSGSSVGTFGSAAAAAKRREESRSTVSHFTSPQTPAARPAYSTPAAPRLPSSWELRNRQLAALRAQVAADTWATRPQRARAFFGRYMIAPSYGYHDSYSPWFWLWLLDRPTYDQGYWFYHHRYSMDQARYDAVMNQNANLQQRVAELERQNLLRDPTYTPPGLPSSDLMYADAMVAAATQPAAQAGSPPMAEAVAGTPSAGRPTYTNYPLPPQGTFIRQGNSGLSGLCCGLTTIALFGGLVAALVAMTRRKSAETWGTIPSAPPPLPQSGGQPARPVPVRVEYPLKLKLGQTFSLDVADYADLVFSVERIMHYTTWVDGQEFNYTEYCGVAGGDSADAQKVQLRVERLPGGGLAVLALRVDDEFEYKQEFYDIVENDRTGVFQITDDATGKITAEYRRPEGVLTAYTASVSEQGQAGQAPASRTLKYWDYSRSVESAQGTVAEYLIVEMEESGHFRVLLGPQIGTEAIRI